MERKGNKIGIMGGTFSPIHTGHLLLAQWALEEARLDHVIFMPTGRSYMKQDSTLDGHHRLQMVQLAIEGNPDFSVSDLEIKRGGNTYTYQTLIELKEIYPEDDFFFITGADCLFAIEKWKSPDLIFQNCTLIAAARNGESLSVMQTKAAELTEKFQASIILLQFPNIEISSTAIRNMVAKGERSIRYLVPDAVEAYIRKENLYR